MPERNTTYFHGTVADLTPGSNVAPTDPRFDDEAFLATQPESMRLPGERFNDARYAYATTDLDTAWFWAERKWDATDHGLPRVFIVEPADPTLVYLDPNGEFAGDHVTPLGWVVVDEVTSGAIYDFWHNDAAQASSVSGR